MFKVLVKCFTCGKDFQFGPHFYAGKCNLRDWGVNVCENCFKGSWEGWKGRAGDLLVRHLKKKGIEVPDRNGDGSLPREFSPPLEGRRETP